MASGKDTGQDWPKNEQQKTARNNLMGLMGQVDEVKDKMKDNVTLMEGRGEKLAELQERSEAITHSAAQLANKAHNAPQ